MLRALSWLRSLRRAFGRPLALLRRHWWIVLVGTACVPVHAYVSLWMPALLGRTLDQLLHKRHTMRAQVLQRGVHI